MEKERPLWLQKKEILNQRNLTESNIDYNEDEDDDMDEDRDKDF